jgi:hypothetical protein
MEGIVIITGAFLGMVFIGLGFTYIQDFLGISPHQKRAREWERRYVERQRFLEDYRQRRRRAFNTTVSIASWRRDGTGRYRAPFWDKVHAVDEFPPWVSRVWPDNDTKNRIPNRPARFLDYEYQGQRRRTRIETVW